MIGDVIKRIRLENKLTQKEMADLLFVSDKTISSWEHDRTVPDIFMLEKISELFHMRMNDLMAGNVSFISKLRYLSMKQIKRMVSFYQKHTFTVIILVTTLLSALILFLLRPLPAYLFMNVLVIATLAILSITYSRWYIALFFISLQILMSDIVLFVNPAYYSQVYDSSQVALLDRLFGYGFLVIFFIGIAYAIYLFIKRSESRFYHLFNMSYVFVWYAIVFLYEKSISVILNFSSFTQQFSYTVEKSDVFWYTTLSYLSLMCLSLWIHQRLRKLKYKQDNHSSI